MYINNKIFGKAGWEYVYTFNIICMTHYLWYDLKIYFPSCPFSYYLEFVSVERRESICCAVLYTIFMQKRGFSPNTIIFTIKLAALFKVSTCQFHKTHLVCRIYACIHTLCTTVVYFEFCYEWDKSA